MATAPEIQLGQIVGTSVDRKEDMALLTGQAKYVDDMTLPGMVWMNVVRSPYAHARIRGVDVSGALAHRGVIAAFSGEELRVVAVLREGGESGFGRIGADVLEGGRDHVGVPAAARTACTMLW